MPKFYDSISDDLGAWAVAQAVFFTASAPLNGKHVNISPKGLPSATFTIFSPTSAGYVDATGSGAETIAHVYENGRITIMFCSFGPAPRILRFFCTGRVVEWDTPEFEIVMGKMGKKKLDGARAVIMLDVFKVQTSCGFGVPRLSISTPPTLSKAQSPPTPPEAVFEDRETLGHWASKQVEKGEIQNYQRANNSKSLDGLNGLRTARRDLGQRIWWEDRKAGLRRVLAQREGLILGFLVGVVLALAARVGAEFWTCKSL